MEAVRRRDERDAREPDVTYTYRPSGQVASRFFSGGPTVPLTYAIWEQLAQIGDPAATTYLFSAKYSYNANSTGSSTAGQSRDEQAV